MNPCRVEVSIAHGAKCNRGTRDCLETSHFREEPEAQLADEIEKTVSCRVETREELMSRLGITESDVIDYVRGFDPRRPDALPELIGTSSEDRCKAHGPGWSCSWCNNPCRSEANPEGCVDQVVTAERERAKT